MMYLPPQGMQRVVGNPQKLGGRPGTVCPSEPPEGTSLARHLDLRLPSASVVTPQMSVSCCVMAAPGDECILKEGGDLGYLKDTRGHCAPSRVRGEEEQQM